MIDFSDKSRLVVNGVDMERGIFIQGGMEHTFFPLLVGPWFIRIYFPPHYYGNNFNISAVGVSIDGVFPNAEYVDVQVPSGEMSYMVATSPVINRWAVNVGRRSGIYDVVIDPSPLNMHNLTPAQIKAIADAGEMEAYGMLPRTLGGTNYEFDMQLATGEVLTFEIYGNYHDELANKSGKAPITFGQKNLMSVSGVMNPTATNIGSFLGSQLFRRLSSIGEYGEGGALHADGIGHTVPQEWRDVMTPIIKLTGSGHDILPRTILEQEFSMFLFSQIETGVYADTFPGEGLRYPVFSDNASRRKYFANGLGPVRWWWTRSPHIAFNWAFMVTLGGGGISLAEANLVQATGNGICFGFCI